MEAADKSCELKICYFSLLAFPSPIISLNPFKKKKKKKDVQNHLKQALKT